jgi:Lar family restriction alleviation protein
MELRECPFCGGKPEFEELGACRGIFCVKCQKCWAKSIFGPIEQKEETIEAWNRRVSRPPVDELLRVIEETDSSFMGFDVDLYTSKLLAIKAAAERCK